MEVVLHPHARERLAERGVTEDEAVSTVKSGERFPAKFGRVGFRRNFSYGKQWRGKYYLTEKGLYWRNLSWLCIGIFLLEFGMLFYFGR